MAENAMDHIVAGLRGSAKQYYPDKGELKNVRIVGHTPKNDHFIYDVVMDFESGSQRLAAKVYRSSKAGAQAAKSLAKAEYDNLSSVHGTFEKKGLDGIPRPVGDFTEFGA